MNNKVSFAEIIEGSLYTWTSQSWQWDNFPSFGSLLAVPQKNSIIVGIVYQIQTGSLDPIHMPVAYQKTEKELHEEQPHIFEFLRTTFSCLTLGFQEEGKIFYQASPQPPKIHAFVEPIPHDTAKLFFQNNRYLHLLFGNAHLVGNLDELLLALLAFKSTISPLNSEYLADFSYLFSLLTGNDYRRLKLFLQRIDHLHLHKG